MSTSRFDRTPLEFSLQIQQNHFRFEFFFLKHRSDFGWRLSRRKINEMINAICTKN
jgi:hypothetical protein